MDNITVSNMELNDLNKIKDILFSDFDDFWNYNILKQEIENPSSSLVVAKCNNEIVGFAGIWDGVDELHITNIVVKKDLRNNGIGNILLEKLVHLAKIQNKNLTLEVNKLNTIAIKLYEKYGFKTLGIRKNYYKGSDANIMTLYFN